MSLTDVLKIASELNELGFNVSIDVSHQGRSILKITKRKLVTNMKVP